MRDDAPRSDGYALQPNKPALLQRAAPLDRAKGEALLARARAALMQWPPAPIHAGAVHAEHVHLPTTCGATGRVFLTTAERDGGTLRMIRAELLPQARLEEAEQPGLLAGAYRITAAAGWACPICGAGFATHRVWVCECTPFQGALHCGGLCGRARWCACGRLEERNIIPRETLQTRGQSLGAASLPPAQAQAHGATSKALVVRQSGSKAK